MSLPARAWARAFLLALAVTAGSVVVAGWLSGVRDVMYTAALSAAAFAFLPFLIILAALAIVLAACVVGAAFALLFGDHIAAGGAEAAAPVAELGVAAIGPYYRFLSRQRHPVFWGVSAGVLAGCLVLAGLVATIIHPREAQTAEILLRCVSSIEDQRAKTGHYPEPLPTGGFDRRLIEPMGDGAAQPELGPVLDGFGRPLVYEVSGGRVLGTFRLRSLGFDGVRGRDDLCSSGATKLSSLVVKADQLLGKVSVQGRSLSISERLHAVRALRCGD